MCLPYLFDPVLLSFTLNLESEKQTQLKYFVYIFGPLVFQYDIYNIVYITWADIFHQKKDRNLDA